MSQWHRRRHWLRAWQLALFAGCITASQNALAEKADVFKIAEQCSAGPSVDATLFQLEGQCPGHGPCYRDRAVDFCVYTAVVQDNTGSSEVVPILADGERASGIMQAISAAEPAVHDRSSVPKHIVRQVPGKGLGAISTGELEKGDRVLSDSPLLIVDHCAMNIPQYQLAWLMNEAAGRLSDVQRVRLMDLAVLGEEPPDEHYLVGRIYATSAYMVNLDHETSDDGCGIGALFPEISRMNHDCRPNSAYYFNVDTAVMEVHAVRPISAGEEITVSYISPLLIHAHRQKVLRDRWGFGCNCAACSASPAEINDSDIRLERISSLLPLLLDKEQDRVPILSDEVNGTEIAELVLHLMHEERLDAVMLQPYRAAALEWNAIGHHERATYYAELAVHHGKKSFGPRDQMVQDMESLLKDPELHWSWKLRSTRADHGDTRL